MSHPILVAALVEDRYRRCRCGAIAQLPCSSCRKCRAAAVWRRESDRASRFSATGCPRAGIARARLLAWITPLLQIISKGAEN